MLPQTIDALAAFDPESPIPHIRTGTVVAGSTWSPLHDLVKDRFLDKYINPQFGWYIAGQFANYEMDFPIAVSGRDWWVYKAYKLRQDPWKNFDRSIVEAYHLAMVISDHKDIGRHVKAFLLCMPKGYSIHQHLSEVSRRLGVPYDVLDAFEALFYNVVDRHADGIFIGNEVYPDTRFVEFDENYMRASKHADLIKRVAYNHGDMDLTAYMSGIGDHTFLKRISASEDREAELARYMMGNGLILSHSNLLNQRSVGMSRVSTLLAASRQGGVKDEEPTVGGIHPLFTGALHAALAENQKQVMNQLRLEAGQESSVKVLDI